MTDATHLIARIRLGMDKREVQRLLRGRGGRVWKVSRGPRSVEQRAYAVGAGSSVLVVRYVDGRVVRTWTEA